MRNFVLAIAVAAAASPVTLHAQEEADCDTRLEEVTARLPDVSESPEAYQEMGLGEEQFEAVLATLDAARIVRDADPQGCVNLVEAAASILHSGGD